MLEFKKMIPGLIVLLCAIAGVWMNHLAGADTLTVH